MNKKNIFICNFGAFYKPQKIKFNKFKIVIIILFLNNKLASLNYTITKFKIFPNNLFLI